MLLKYQAKLLLCLERFDFIGYRPPQFRVFYFGDFFFQVSHVVIVIIAISAKLLTTLALNANLYAFCAKRFAYNARAFDNHRMEIGQVIRALRQKRRETLEQIALGVGTDPSNLSRIERGGQQPSAELLRAIAAALQTTVGSLYACAEGQDYSADKPQDLLGADESDYTSEAIQLRRQFRTLTPGNQRLAVELLKALRRMQDTK